MRHNDVVSTSVRRLFDVMCPVRVVSAHMSVFNIPTGTKRRDDVVITSMRRHRRQDDVVSTSYTHWDEAVQVLNQLFVFS